MLKLVQSKPLIVRDDKTFRDQGLLLIPLKEIEKHTVMTETHCERESVSRKSGHENITRKGYLVYYGTKVNNL